MIDWGGGTCIKTKASSSYGVKSNLSNAGKWREGLGGGDGLGDGDGLGGGDWW